jgi:hypothetical protein
MFDAQNTNVVSNSKNFGEKYCLNLLKNKPLCIFVEFKQESKNAGVFVRAPIVYQNVFLGTIKQCSIVSRYSNPNSKVFPPVGYISFYEIRSSFFIHDIFLSTT